MDNLFMAGIAYYLGIIELGAGVYRAGMHNIKRQALLLQKLKPTGIMTVPSFLLELGKEIRGEGIDPLSLSVKKALLVGDSIRDQKFQLSGIGELLKKTWPLDLYSTFGNSEAAISYCECRHKHGGHEHSDLIITEIIDEDDNVVPDGEMGELVLTTLQTRGMPLLRYCTGDITFKITKPCVCGRNSSRIGPIMGRKAHMLKYKGTKVYPKAIENAIAGIDGVHNYVVEAFTGDNFSDKVVVKIGSEKRSESFKRLLCAQISASARVIPTIKFTSTKEIYSLQSDKGRSRKPKTFIDHRNVNTK
jgi:phenylacetate-CoA ligase